MYSFILSFLISINISDKPIAAESIWGKYNLIYPEGNRIELIFKSDSSFLMTNRTSMATIINEGKYEVICDSIFLTYLKPAFQNTIDTFTYDNHFQTRRDTLWIIDENEIATGTEKVSDRYYQLEKHFEDGSINITKDWELRDSTLIEEGPNGTKNIYILRGRRVKNGFWTYYNRNGDLIKHE